MSEIYKFKPGDKPSDAELDAAEEIVAEGEMDGYKYFIRTNGMFPTAYVKTTKKKLLEYQGYAKTVAHGGFTFSGKFPSGEPDGYWLGWDYAHAGDYMALFPNLNDAAKMLYGEPHKYTVQEIMEDVKRVVELLKGEDNEQD